jgi:murein L,D-transpeptidase YcbB/YkuD
MKEEEPWRVDLNKTMPVYVLYWTAWVDDGGLVHFRDDVYGRDADLDHALQQQASTNRIGEVAHMVSSSEDNHYQEDSE